MDQYILFADGKQLSTTENRLGWLEASRLDEQREQLKQRYNQQGYLWLKGLLPVEDILEFRAQYFEAFRETLMLKPDSDAKDGFGNPDFTPNRKVTEIENQVVLWESYTRISQHPNILAFLKWFLGEDLYLHRRKMVRRMMPDSGRNTPAHYDLTYLRKGTDRSLITIWTPLGDIPVEMGGLIYLEGSHTAGARMEEEFRIKNANLPPDEQMSAYNRNMTEGGWVTKDLPSLADRLNTRWLIANYEAGDIVIHSPYMIHASTINNDTSGRIRLSSDIRYQLGGDSIDERWSNNWFNGDNL